MMQLNSRGYSIPDIQKVEINGTDSIALTIPSNGQKYRLVGIYVKLENANSNTVTLTRNSSFSTAASHDVPIHSSTLSSATTFAIIGDRDQIFDSGTTLTLALTSTGTYKGEYVIEWL